MIRQRPFENAVDILLQLFFRNLFIADNNKQQKETNKYHRLTLFTTHTYSFEGRAGEGCGTLPRMRDEY